MLEKRGATVRPDAPAPESRLTRRLFGYQGRLGGDESCGTRRRITLLVRRRLIVKTTPYLFEIHALARTRMRITR